ncbi:unnamed protein product, partial [Allacma fusca]
MFQFASLCVCQ